LNVLSESSVFIGKEFNCAVAVMDGVDPQGKRRFAEPGRPAIYIEKLG